jgi:hypothetical protein
MRMFFFGSLRDQDLLAVVLGRSIDDLIFTEATLLGFERRRARDEAFPIIVPHPGGRVDGVVVDGLTAADLDRIQFYESDDYELRPFAVETPAGRVEAQVFLPTEALEDEGVTWDFEVWLEEEKPMCLFLAEELMSYYGVLTPEQYEALWPEMKERARERLAREAPRHKRALGGRIR